MTEKQVATAAEIAGVIYGEGVPWFNAKIIAAQTMVETAAYTSNVFLTDNNVGGMKMPSVRKSPFIVGPGLQPPGNEGSTKYAHYKSYSDGAKDLVHLFKYNGIKWETIASVLDWSMWLKQKGYYGGTIGTYAAAIESHLKNLKDVIEPVILGGKKKTNLFTSIFLAVAIAAILTMLWLFLLTILKPVAKRRVYNG